MKQVEYIIGIYRNFNPIPEDLNLAGYYFLYLLDQKGMLDFKEASSLYQQKYGVEVIDEVKNLNQIGPFESVDTLNQYAFMLCEKFNAEKISLLSVQDYNQLLESNQQASDFYRDLIEKGNILQNIEHKKKGLLSRIFK